MRRFDALPKFAALAMFSGCAMAHDVGGTSNALSAPIALSADCQQEVDDSIDGLPNRLECTGLYKDMGKQTFSSKVKEFRPAYPLWSDASVKTRWIYLPDGASIDASDPAQWEFPVGTRFWKEFRNPAGDRLIETRLFMKMDDNDWSKTTYVWDDAGKAAKRLDSGKDVDIDGNPYRIPSNQECDDCHAGRRDRALGYDQVALGFDATEGASLSDLLDRHKLKNFSGDEHYQIGPDPESDEARALGWIHTNCGVSCHNDNPNSKAYSNGMRLVLDPAQLDGRDTAEFKAITTTVGVDVFALQWRGKKRIVPGKPEDSWLYTLITQRGNPKEQMPPLASNRVDTDNTEIIKSWISSLAPVEANATDEPE
jgi:hypothetical protein